MASTMVRSGVALLLAAFLISGIVPVAIAGAPDKEAQEEVPAKSSLLPSNLVIYAPGMWLVLRYDAQSNSLLATASDSSGPALWQARNVQVTQNPDGSISIDGLAVQKLGGPQYVDWEKFDIQLQDTRATITKTNPNGTDTYVGKAVKIKTFGQDKT